MTSKMNWIENYLLNRRLAILILLAICSILCEVALISYRLMTINNTPWLPGHYHHEFANKTTPLRVGKGSLVFGGQRNGYPEVGPELDLLNTNRALKQSDSANKPKIVLIIDDFGHQLYTEPVQGFLQIDIPLTVAVMPGLWASRQVAAEARKLGKEVILHLPMEPEHMPSGTRGPMIMTSMTRDEIFRVLDQTAREFPEAYGLSNHMGSLATQNPWTMKALTKWCNVRNWWVVDSITHPGSVLYAEALREGAPAIKRDIFLDHVDDPSTIRAALHRAVRAARRIQRPIIAIAHPRELTWEVLKEEIPRMKNNGVEFIPLSLALERPN